MISRFNAILLALFLSLAPSWAQMGQIPAYVQPAPSGGTYTGPGDVVSGASHWYGLRAYNAAYAVGGTNPVADIVDTATGLAACTIPIGTNGSANLAAVACPTGAPTVSVTTFCTVTHSAGCSVTKLYDQIGTSHATQATLASMPVLALGSVSGIASNRPAMIFAGGQKLSITLSLGIPQPLSFSSVAVNTNSGTVGGILADAVANNAEMIFGNSANQTLIYAGGTPIVMSATDVVWHAISGVFNGSSSIMNVDGTTSSTGSPGSGTLGSPQIGEDSFGDFLKGNIVEIGIWPSALSGTNMTSLSGNAHSYWGF